MLFYGFQKHNSCYIKSVNWKQLNNRGEQANVIANTDSKQVTLSTARPDEKEFDILNNRINQQPKIAHE